MRRLSRSDGRIGLVAGGIRRADGLALVVVLLILVGVSLLGVGAVQMATLSERSARNDRDAQIAYQAAEAALLDAEIDIRRGRKGQSFDGSSPNGFAPGCAGVGDFQGLCGIVTQGTPAWMDVDFAQTEGARSVALGTFTGRSFSFGKTGLQPVQAPRYIIELVADPTPGLTAPRYLYGVTAVGFGPRSDIQVALQMLYRSAAAGVQNANNNPDEQLLVTPQNALAGMRLGRLSWRRIENFQEINSGQ